MSSRPIRVGPDRLGLTKLGLARFDLHDPYYLALSLSWGGFALLMLACWLGLNIVFAAAYIAVPGAITNLHAGRFSDAIFFSIETLSTVGYGIMAPATVYGHIVSAIETVAGLVFTAVGTGLLFVRFSRPKPKIIFAAEALISEYESRPTLMIRVAHGRTSFVSDVHVRLFLVLTQPTAGQPTPRRIQELRVVEDHSAVFLLPWTVMHVIDETSPLHGHTRDSLATCQVGLFLAVAARDHLLSAEIRDVKDYGPDDIRFGARYAEIVTADAQGRTVVDLQRIGALEHL